MVTLSIACSVAAPASVLTKIVATPPSISFPVAGGTQDVTLVAVDQFDIPVVPPAVFTLTSVTPANLGISASLTGNILRVVGSPNAGPGVKSATIVFSA